MLYPNHTTYQSLYTKYFEGNRTEQLVALAGDLAGKKIADLCGGGGRLSREASAKGAEVTLVDESPAMVGSASQDAITYVLRSVDDWLAKFLKLEEFDALFCQQAVNYWLTPELAPLLAATLKPGGVFVFNTFNKKPATYPTPKSYVRDGVSFMELSWLSGTRTVEHVQIREGQAPHTTCFNWIAPAEFQQWLSPFFDTKELIEGASSVWVCRKR